MNAPFSYSPFDDASGKQLIAFLAQHGITPEGSGFVLNNNTYLSARNAADSADLSLLKADASNNTILNALTAKKVSVTVNAVEELAVDGTTVTLPTNDLALTAGSITLAGLGKTLTLKAGANAKAGTFTANGSTPVTVSTTAFIAGSTVAISLKTVGGTVGAIPHLATTTPNTGFTVVGTASDTSVYNWAIIDQA